MSKGSVAFIGSGVMGQSMAGHLMDAGYSLTVYNRTKAKAQPLLDRGAGWADSVKAAVKDADFVITMVGYPHDVEEVYLGEAGIISFARRGALAMDMTTSKPSLAKAIWEAARAREIDALDAPVSGGDKGAREGTLSIMVGGEEAAFEKARPLFEAMGRNVVLQGPAGSGQFTKMSNQIAIAAGMLGVCEAMLYAERAGLDPRRVLKSIESGAAGSWSLSNLAPRFLNGDFEPGFYVKHFIKDMGIALESAREMGLELPGLSLAKQLYDRLVDRGAAENGTQALYKLYKDGI